MTTSRTPAVPAPLAALAALLVACSPSSDQAQPGDQPATIAFTGATVWDGSGADPVEGATVVVRQGRVVSVGTAAPPSGAVVVPLDGRYVIPGLVNAHAHVTGLWAPEGTEDVRSRVEADLLLFARYGITTVNSLGGEPAEAFLVRDAQASPALDHARVYMAGPVIAATTEADARAAVADNAAAGVNWMKIRVDDNLGTTAKMPWEAVEGVLDEAHARGFRVATHLFYLEDAKRLLRAGSDMVAHSIRDAAVDDEVLGLLAETGVCTVPTLTREVSAFAYAERPDFFDDPFFLRYADRSQMDRVSAPDFQRAMAESPAAARYRVGLAQAQRNLKSLVDAGLPVAFGTDAGPAARFPGFFEHLELTLMAEAGLTPAQVLYAATGGSAACLGLSDVGVLEAGRWADFLVLEADPLADVNNTRRLAAVYVAGNEVR